MTDLPLRWGGLGILRNGGNPSNGGMILKCRGHTPLRTMSRKSCFHFRQQTEDLLLFDIQGGSLSINSRRNISLSALDENNNVLGQLTLTGNQIILKNKQLLIQDHNGRTVMHADDKSMTINTDNMELKGMQHVGVSLQLESFRNS